MARGRLAKSVARWLALFLLLLVCTGCVNEKVNGETHTFTYELWVLGLLILGGPALSVGGWALRQSAERAFWAMLVGGVVALVVGVSMSLEKVTVDDKEFHARIGWGKTHDVAFADVSQIRITREERRGRRGRREVTDYVNFDRKGGPSEKVTTGNSLCEEALVLALIRCAANDIQILDQTGGGQ